jgi:hypothetical protein
MRQMKSLGKTGLGKMNAFIPKGSMMENLAASFCLQLAA